MRLLATLLPAFGLAVGAATGTHQSQSAPRFPEQASYCRPALAAMDRYYDGKTTLETATREATAAAEACLTTNPLGAQLSLAQIYVVTNKRPEALRAARAAEAIDPGNSEAQRRICGLVADPAAALAACRRATELAPRSVLALREIGDLHARQGRRSDAALAYSKALEINPGYAAGWLQRAYLRLDLGEFSGALADAERADPLVPDADPDASAVAIGKARALAGLNRGAEALEVLDRRLQVAPNDAPARYRRGVIQVAMGRPREGFRDCAAVRARFPQDQLAQKCLADARARVPAGERQRTCQRGLALSQVNRQEIRVLGGADFATTLPSLSYFPPANDQVRVSVFIGNVSWVPEEASTYSEIKVTVEVNRLFGLSPRQRDLIYAEMPENAKTGVNNEGRLSAVVRQDEYLEKRLGFPVRIEVGANSMAATATEAQSAVQLILRASSRGTPAERQIAEHILKTGRFGLTVWNEKTGAKLLDREIVLDRYLPDRAVIASTIEALRAEHIPFWC